MENGLTVSPCDLNNYLVYTDVSKFNSWIEQVIIETYIGQIDDVMETSAGQSVLKNTCQMKLFFFIFSTLVCFFRMP
jgi:hypothetical protein